MTNKELMSMSTSDLEEMIARASAALEAKQNDPKTLRVRRAPDGYRGNFSCVEFLDLDARLERINPGGHPEQDWLIRDGNRVAKLTTWYGNNGLSDRLAAEEIEPLPGTTIEWID